MMDVPTCADHFDGRTDGQTNRIHYNMKQLTDTRSAIIAGYRLNRIETERRSFAVAVPSAAAATGAIICRGRYDCKSRALNNNRRTEVHFCIRKLLLHHVPFERLELARNFQKNASSCVDHLMMSAHCTALMLMLMWKVNNHSRS